MGPKFSGEHESERLDSPEKLADFYESVRKKVGVKMAARLVEANNVLTIAGIRPQTEFYISRPTEKDYAELKELSDLCKVYGIYIDTDKGEFTHPRGFPMLAIGIHSFKALEDLPKDFSVFKFPIYNRKTRIEGLRKWQMEALGAIKAAQEKGSIAKEYDPEHIFIGLIKGYPLVAVLDAAAVIARNKILSEELEETRLPSADLYGGARSEFSFAKEHKNHPDIVATVARWERTLQDFYATKWHKRIASNDAFKKARRDIETEDE